MSAPCYCGHDCSRCYVYLARNDPAMAGRATAFYREKFGIDVPPDKLHCCGGRSGDVFYMCEGCPFRRCCRERGLASCDDCAEQCEAFIAYKKKYVNKCGQI